MQRSNTRTIPTIPVWAMAVALGVLSLAGCQSRAQNAAEVDPGSAEPAELLEGMLAAYAEASTYSDQGEIIFSHNAGGRAEVDGTGLAIAFSRPGQVRLELDFGDAKIRMANNGTQILARIEAEESNNFDNQFVIREAPQELNCGSLYEAMTLVVPSRDPGNVPVSVLEGPYVRLEQLPLGLLLGDSQLPAIVADAKKITELDSSDFEGHACRRVRIEAPEGEFTFWIDAENLVLRKLEYPAKALTAGKVAPGMVRDLSLVAEFHDAKLNEPLPRDTFNLERPEGARQVTRFVQPVLEIPPAHLGEQVGEYSLADLRGQELPSSQWQDKIVALFFFDNHPDCGVAAAHVELVRQNLTEKLERGELEPGKIVLLGVCTESVEDLGEPQLRTLAGKWQIGFPVVRDPAAAGRDVLHVREAPAVVVLNGERQIQFAQAGATPNLGQELFAVLERLNEGDDLAREHLDYYAEQSQLYRLALAAVGPGGEESVVELPNSDRPLPARDEPKHVTLEEAWSSDELQSPGNMIVVPGQDGGDDTVYLLDGWRSIVQLDASGAIARRIELELPEQAAISFVRQGVDAEGRVWFAGTSKLAQQAFLFNDQWELVLSYPDVETEHPGVQDVLPADFDGADGEPLRLYVAFWGTAGVHGVNLDGSRAWLNRSVQPALSLSCSLPNAVGWKSLLVTSSSGSIVPINRFGNAEAGVEAGRDGVHGLFAGREPIETGAAYLGLTIQSDGKLVMKGISPELQEAWRYSLPAGIAAGVRPVTSGRLLSDVPMQWLFAGADGSLHLVSADTSIVDWFHYGSRIDGMGIARLGGQPLLLVASEGNVAAYRVTRKAEAAESPAE